MNKGDNLFSFLMLIIAVFPLERQTVCETIDTTSVSFETVLDSREVARKPGTLLYESGKFNLQDKYNTVSVTGLNLELPEGTNEVTWSVEFTNLGTGQAGLLLYSPPTIGESYDDFWEKTINGWKLKSITESANFGARLAGVPDGESNETIVYENAKNSLGKTYISGGEVGDSVLLNGVNSNLTGIQFEYYASMLPLDGLSQGRLRIYLNDGESVNVGGVSVDPRGDFGLSSGEITIYDNSRGEKEDVYFLNSELGDSFMIESAHRVIQKIQFEYFAALNPFERNQTGVFRVYANDGDTLEGSNIPNTLLFASDSFELRSGYNMVTISDVSIEVPADIKEASWTVEFSGMGQISQAGLLMHEKPVVGQSLAPLWKKNITAGAENWQLINVDEGLGGLSIRMAARIPSFPNIVTDQNNYVVGETIKVSFDDGPKNSKDWIGIYGLGMIPGSVDALDWAYVNGSKIAGEERADGMVVFSSQLPIGEYFAKFFENDSYGELASYRFRVVPPPVVSPAKTVFNVGEKVVVNFDYGPSNAKDWIAIYRPETDPSKLPSLSWAYVGGSRTVGDALGKGDVVLSDNLAAGNYVIRFFENDSYKQLAESVFVVKDMSTPPKLTIQHKVTGEVILRFEGVLEASPSVNGPWSILNGSSEIVLPSSNSRRFFRAVN